MIRVKTENDFPMEFGGNKMNTKDMKSLEFELK